jgi:hypothetical protein
MAEQAASAVASAVIGGVTDRAFTTVMRKLRSRSRSGPAAAHEKLQRLETLVLKVPDREARHRERLPAGVARQAEGGRSGRPRLPTPSQGGRQGSGSDRTRAAATCRRHRPHRRLVFHEFSRAVWVVWRSGCATPRGGSSRPMRT